jgi:hypothetical protein
MVDVLRILNHHKLMISINREIRLYPVTSEIKSIRYIVVFSIVNG